MRVFTIAKTSCSFVRLFGQWEGKGEGVGLFVTSCAVKVCLVVVGRREVIIVGDNITQYGVVRNKLEYGFGNRSSEPGLEAGTWGRPTYTS